MEAQLLKALFRASTCKNSDISQSLLSAVGSVIPVKMCSLWKVNNRCRCLSIYARERYSPRPELDFEYVHLLQGSLIGYLLRKAESEDRKYIDIPSVLDKPYIKYHKSPGRVRALGLRRMICIPIPNPDASSSKQAMDAVLNIYPKDDANFEESYAEVIQDFFSVTLSRSRLISREELTRDLMSIYEARADKDLPSVLHPILHSVLRKYLKFEGCSVFIWDPFSNLLRLAQSTGITGKPLKADVFYYLGEGLTGTIAAERRPLILEDVRKLGETGISEHYEHKWTESTRSSGRSFMGIPIMSPSHPSELLGVIRFTNKLNPLGDVVDKFSDEDYDLVNHATNLIALYMDYEQGEKIRTAFAMQMAHEMLTPATAIRGSARRLQRYWFLAKFPKRKVDDYLNSILDHSELQIALTRTIEYVWKGSTGTPRVARYQVARHKLDDDVISKARKLVIPIARGEGLTFDNITIEGDFPFLFVDKFAFEQVFFNLLTNAIKYRVNTQTATFEIKIVCHGRGTYKVPTGVGNQVAKSGEAPVDSFSPESGCLVTVSDLGTGVNKGEARKIFNLGYRRKGIERTNVRGLGIGLAVVQRILADFGCSIWVSNYISPTVFSIFLPQMLETDRYVQSLDWRRT